MSDFLPGTKAINVTHKMCFKQDNYDANNFNVQFGCKAALKRKCCLQLQMWNTGL